MAYEFAPDHFMDKDLNLPESANGGAEISSEFTITETLGASAMLYSVLHAVEP